MQINPAAGISAALIYAGYILFDIISIMRRGKAHFRYRGNGKCCQDKIFIDDIKPKRKWRPAVLNLFDITKVLEEEEKIYFTFKISRSHLHGFTLLMQGLSEINNHLCASIRRAENRIQAKLDAMEQARNNRDMEVRRAIRERLKGLRNKGLTPLKAFKEIRKKEELKHLVRQVQEEEQIKTELEILRLHRHGFKSHEIGLKVPMSAGAIRKVLSRLTPPTPSPRRRAPRPRPVEKGKNDLHGSLPFPVSTREGSPT